MLLLDNMLSWRLIARLEHEFPGLNQAKTEGFDCKADIDIWAFVRLRDLVVVTCGGDFLDIQNRLGSSPKLVWLDVADTNTNRMERLLLTNSEEIRQFVDSDEDVLRFPAP